MVPSARSPSGTKRRSSERSASGRKTKTRRLVASTGAYPAGWNDVTPVDAEKILLGSDEGGFMSLEELDESTYFGINSSAEQTADISKKLKELNTGSKPDGEGHLSTRKLTLKKDSKENVKIKVKSKKLAIFQTTTVQTLSVPDQPEEPSIELQVLGADALEEVSDLARVKVPQCAGEEKQGQFVKAKKRKGHRNKGNQVTLQNPQSDTSGEITVSTKQNGIDEETPTEIQERPDMSAWAHLRLQPILEDALADLGFTEPTPIQRACIPAAAHQGKDVVGAAETGSGKTLAFGIPIIQRLLEERAKAAAKGGPSKGLNPEVQEEATPLRALVVTPTRELALQVCQHMTAIAKPVGIRVAAIVGGMAPQKQQRVLRGRPHIVVATPGRLWELMASGEPHLLQLDSLSFFVLDEADRMVERGHFRELQSIIDLLPSSQKLVKDSLQASSLSDAEGGEDEARGTEDGELGDKTNQQHAGLSESSSLSQGTVQTLQKKRQTLVFSATLALPSDFRRKLKRAAAQLRSRGREPDGGVATLMQRAGVSHKAAVVDLTTKQVVAGRLQEAVIECVAEEKDTAVAYVVRVHGSASGRTLIFCSAISAVRRVAALLALQRVPSWPLHAQMQQRQRLKAMDRFRSSPGGVLVATDVAARGLDIAGVSTVVHYQLPHSAEVYVHRSGRTARAGAAGCSVAIVSPPDRAKYSSLLRALNKPSLSPFPLDPSLLSQVRRSVQLALKIDETIRRTAQDKAKSSWLKQNADALDIVAEGDEIGRRKKTGQSRGDEEEEDAGRPRLAKGEQQALRGMQLELRQLLQQPLLPRSFSRKFATGVEVSPLLAQHVTQLKGSVGQKDGAGPRRPGFVVIGQQSCEALEALRTSIDFSMPRKKVH